MCDSKSSKFWLMLGEAIIKSNAIYSDKNMKDCLDESKEYICQAAGMTVRESLKEITFFSNLMLNTALANTHGEDNVKLFQIIHEHNLTLTGRLN